jgi:hypothetical protein
LPIRGTRSNAPTKRTLRGCRIPTRSNSCAGAFLSTAGEPSRRKSRSPIVDGGGETAFCC